MGQVKTSNELQPHPPWTNMHFESAMPISGTLLGASKFQNFKKFQFPYLPFNAPNLISLLKISEYYIIKLALNCFLSLVTVNNSCYWFKSKRFWVTDTNILGFFPSFYHNKVFPFWYVFALKAPKTFNFNKTGDEFMFTVQSLVFHRCS